MLPSSAATTSRSLCAACASRPTPSAAKLGRPIPIAAQVSGEWAILKQGDEAKAVAQKFLAGFDIGRWAQEGLVDIVSPSFRRSYKPTFLEHLQRDLGSAQRQVQLIPSLGQHDNAIFPPGYEWSLYFTDRGEGRTDLAPFGELDAWRVLREAHDLYQQGAFAGGLLWGCGRGQGTRGASGHRPVGGAADWARPWVFTTGQKQSPCRSSAHPLKY